MPNVIRSTSEVYDAPIADIVLTYAAMTGKLLPVGCVRRAAETATVLAMMVNQDRNAHLGIPRGTKPGVLTLKELDDKKRRQAAAPSGAWGRDFHFRTAHELSLESNMAKAKKTTKQAADTSVTATATTEAVGADHTAEAANTAAEGAATETASADATATQTAATQDAGATTTAEAAKPKARAVAEQYLRFAKNPKRAIRAGSLRDQIMAFVAKTGMKSTLTALNAHFGKNVRGDVKVLIDLEHAAEVTKEVFDKLPSDEVTYVNPGVATAEKAGETAGEGEGEATTGATDGASSEQAGEGSDTAAEGEAGEGEGQTDAEQQA